MPVRSLFQKSFWKGVWVPPSRTTEYSSAFNRRFKTASLGTGRFGSKPVVSFFSFCARKKTYTPPAMSTIAMPTPTYVLIADLSSLVIRPPYIRSRLTLLNQRLAASVKTEWAPSIYHREHGKRGDHPQILKLARFPARSLLPLRLYLLCR